MFALPSAPSPRRRPGPPPEGAGDDTKEAFRKWVGVPDKYDVKAPSTTGNEIWERMYRVHMNTLEQLVIFIPSVVLFSTYVSNRWVLVPGVLFIIGRQLYSYEYVKDPDSRVPGMALSGLSNAVLLLGALLGIVLKLV